MLSSRFERVTRSPWLVFLGCPLLVSAFAGCGLRAAESANAKGETTTLPAGAHPLDPALDIARAGLKKMQQNVRDYTAILAKQERIGGELGEYQYLQVKVRHRRTENGRVVTPFSVYLKFLGPSSLKGREVIWVEGANEGKLVAHDAGITNFLRVKLEPTGMIAMMGNRYPITQIGMLNLVEQLIIKGTRDRQHPNECEVKFFENAKVDGRACRLIRVIHPQRRDYFDFHRAEIFIDTQLDVPTRYAAWTWPAQKGGEPVLEEEYTYRDVRLNVGLSDRDFDPDNPDYNFP